jgi:MFS family permease
VSADTAGPRRGESLAAFARVFANRDLRRVQLAGVGSTMGYWGYLVALLVWAYAEDGAALAGIATFVRLAPGAVVAPFAGALADRYPRKRVMVSSDLFRAVLQGLAAGAIALSLPPAAVLALVALSGVGASVFRPAQAALLPSITRTPEELTAANVVASAVDGTGAFVGPALGGLLLTFSGPATVFAASVGCLLWSAALVAGVKGETPPMPRDGGLDVRGLLHDVREGFSAVASGARVRLLIGLVGAQTLVAGLLSVLVVVIALDLLRRGPGFLGVLEGALGVGGLIGVAISAALVGRGLAAALGAGTVLFGAPLLLVAGWEAAVTAVIALGVIGIANTLADVSSATLLQRAVDDAVLGRVFAVLETIALATIALGGLLAPVLVSALGARGALIATGLILPVVVAATWRPLRAIDAAVEVPARPLALLRGLPIFGPLPPMVLERLAFDAQPLSLPAGPVFRQGDMGERFYVIAEGEVEIEVDGVRVRTEGPGEAFGEIALLQEIPRTATVTATGPVELYALDRDAFVTAVTGSPASAEAAETHVASLLAMARPGMLNAGT